MSLSFWSCYHSETQVDDDACERIAPEPDIAVEVLAEDSTCHTPESEDSSDEAVCAICFEHTQFVELPCECRINYCGSCWDRALAISVRNAGRARCPSCRTGFSLDFNQSEACIVYSKDDRGVTPSELRTRLYRKARPVQTKLLRNFGTAVKNYLDAEANARVPIEGPSCEESDKMIAAEDQKKRKCLAGVAQCEPLCMCGGVLKKVDTRTRTIDLLDDTQPGWRLRNYAEQQIEAYRAIIICDLCDGVATRTGAVWTCEKGPDTVLHPCALDICEPCFAKHVGSDNVATIKEIGQFEASC